MGLKKKRIKRLIQVAKIIGTGLATTGLIGAGVGIGVVFGALILGFVFSEATGLFALMMAFLLLSVALFKQSYLSLEWALNSPPKPHIFNLSLESSSFSMMGLFDESKPYAVEGKGIYIITKDGRKVIDGCSGAGVSSIGHRNRRVIDAITKQNKTGISYLSSSWGSRVVDDFCKFIIRGIGGKMVRVYIVNSGSESTEVAMKLAYSYHRENNDPRRINIISRVGSYHGATLLPLTISGFYARKHYYNAILNKDNFYYVSACYAYRQKLKGETDVAFASRKAAELEAKILEIGPGTVMAFILEPVVGAALGCAPFVPGYLKAMREVCDKYGVLLIYDEVMCGMGRTGTMHAWQAEGVGPDIQTNAKGLGGGYVPIAMVLASKKVIDVINKGSGEFVHGQTYEGMPSTVAGALEVQRVIKDNKLVKNVSKQGAYLGWCLRAVLSNHPNVGDIRGLGLFWGIEFVENKGTKKPFDPKLEIAKRIVDLAFSPEFNLAIYYGGFAGYYIHIDRIIIAPPFIIKKKEVDCIVEILSKVIERVFNEVGTKRI